MFDDIRREAFEMAKAARAGLLDPQRALAAAACLKVMNDTFQLELSFRKLGVEVPTAAPALEHQPAVIEHAPEEVTTSALSAALDVPDKAPEPKKRPPNILVLGMRPTQIGRVSEKLNGTADLFSWTTDDGHLVLRSLAKRADLIVMASGGAVNHSDTEALARDGLTWAKAQNNHASVLTAIKEFFASK